MEKRKAKIDALGAMGAQDERDQRQAEVEQKAQIQAML